MYARHVFSALVLAACSFSSPIPSPADPAPNVCVLIGGDDPVVIDPFNRPQCACKCIIQACQQSDPAQTDLCLRTPWPDPDYNPFPDTLVRYAACVGSTHCVGG